MVQMYFVLPPARRGVASRRIQLYFETAMIARARARCRPKYKCNAWLTGADSVSATFYRFSQCEVQKGKKLKMKEIPTGRGASG